MTSIYIKADKFYYPYDIISGGFIEIRSDGTFGKHRHTVPDGASIIDYSGLYVAPGLVDTHIHGYHGVDVMDNDVDGLLHTLSEGLLETGVTSFLTTPLTASFEALYGICEAVGRYADQTTGAKIQGLFLEGPYFTQEHKGAQNPLYMRNPSIDEFNEWQKAANGKILKIAMAPERQGASRFIQEVTDSGTKIALGHSNATYAQAVKAVEAGASIWVHAYNGMRGFSHRELGMVGAAYELPHTYAELICDGHHVDPKACEILIKQKGADYIVLITDCMRAGGEPDGDYQLGDYTVVVENGTARLKNGDSLAGSVLQLCDAVKNVVDWGIMSTEQAIRSATLIPAISVGIADKCGQIKVGRQADFIILTPNLDLVATYLDGIKVWEVNASNDISYW